MRTTDRPADAGVRTTFDQGVWWTDVNGITRLISELPPSYRVNIAGYLVKNAARYHAKKRWLQLWIFPLTGNPYLDERTPDDTEPYSDEEIKRKIYQEQERGEHLDWLRGTVLFKAIIDGIEELLPPDVRGTPLPEEPHGGAW